MSKFTTRQGETISTQVPSSTPSKGGSTKTIDKSRDIRRFTRLIKMNREYTSESAVWKATVAQAVRDTYDKNPAIRNDVVEWMESGEDYEFVCWAAGIDPDRLRAELENLFAMKPILRKKFAIGLRYDILVGVYSQDVEKYE